MFETQNPEPYFCILLENFKTPSVAVGQCVGPVLIDYYPFSGKAYKKKKGIADLWRYKHEKNDTPFNPSWQWDSLDNECLWVNHLFRKQKKQAITAGSHWSPYRSNAFLTERSRRRPLLRFEEFTLPTRSSAAASCFAALSACKWSSWARMQETFKRRSAVRFCIWHKSRSVWASASIYSASAWLCSSCSNSGEMSDCKGRYQSELVVHMTYKLFEVHAYCFSHD